MKCPVCGKDVDKSSNNCIYCGASLYGPRSINLNAPNENPNEPTSDNIGKITGIDINTLPKGEMPAPDPSIKKAANKKKMNKFLDVSSKIVMIASLILFIVSIVFYFKGKNEPDCPEKKCPVAKKDFYGSVGNISFIVPEGYDYQTVDTKAAISNGNLNIIINGTINYRFFDLTNEKLTSFYSAKGYVTASYMEDALGDKTIKLVQFSASNKKFTDFFYGLDDTTIVYGQLSAAEGDVLTDDARKVIKSLKVIEKEHISISQVVINYEELFKNR